MPATRPTDFLATHSIGFVISNSMYEKTRPETEFGDLPNVKENRKAFLEHFKDIGIEEFIEAEDSLVKYRKGLNAIRIKAIEAHES